MDSELAIAGGAQVNARLEHFRDELKARGYRLISATETDAYKRWVYTHDSERTTLKLTHIKGSSELTATQSDDISGHIQTFTVRER